jgi:hypothetical protein
VVLHVLVGMVASGVRRATPFGHLAGSEDSGG